MNWLDRLRGVRVRIRFADARVDAVRGRPSAGFLSACRDIARLHRIPRGTVLVVGQGRRSELRFSRGIPPSARQAIRNVWTPPPSGGGGGMRASG